MGKLICESQDSTSDEELFVTSRKINPITFMKNKIILTLICLVSLPAFINAYNPTDTELRSSIFDYIGTQSRRQQYQDIIDTGNKGYKDAFDIYYQNTSALENEYNLKLKELEMKEDAQKRSDAWQKEKALLDRELELMRKEEALRVQQKNLEGQKSSEDLVQYMQGVTDKMLEGRELKEKTGIKPYQYAKETSVPLVHTSEVSADGAEIDTPIPKKNAFSRFFTKIFQFFK